MEQWLRDALAEEQENKIQQQIELIDALQQGEEK